MPKAKATNNADEARLVRIYALFDPRDNDLFYVGSTWLPLEIRRSQHIAESLSRHAWYSKKQARIRAIAASECLPEIVLLDICPSRIRRECETGWIRFCTAQGAQLTNQRKNFA